MANIQQSIEYVILKNDPYNDAYGQFIFDILQSNNQFPGRSLSELPDLYTQMENVHEPITYKLRTDVGDPALHKRLFLSNIIRSFKC